MTRKILCGIICLLILVPVAAQGTITITNPGGELNSINNGGCGAVLIFFNPPSCAVTVSGLIFSIISILLGIVGLIAVLFMIIGGFRYVTAHSNEEQAENAKKTILNAVIGVVIIILAYAIVRVIAQALLFGRV